MREYCDSRSEHNNLCTFEKIKRIKRVDPALIYGKDFDDEPIPISNIIRKMEKVTVCGTVLRLDSNNMQDKLPASIIILTDGYAPIPSEKEAMGIPVLWLINNKNVSSAFVRQMRFLQHSLWL